jgi:hypothetical protein
VLGKERGEGGRKIFKNNPFYYKLFSMTLDIKKII